jgi:hypothetical protein
MIPLMVTVSRWNVFRLQFILIKHYSCASHLDQVWSMHRKSSQEYISVDNQCLKIADLCLQLESAV